MTSVEALEQNDQTSRRPSIRLCRRGDNTWDRYPPPVSGCAAYAWSGCGGGPRAGSSSRAPSDRQTGARAMPTRTCRCCPLGCERPRPDRPQGRLRGGHARYRVGWQVRRYPDAPLEDPQHEARCVRGRDPGPNRPHLTQIGPSCDRGPGTKRRAKGGRVEPDLRRGHQHRGSSLARTFPLHDQGGREGLDAIVVRGTGLGHLPIHDPLGDSPENPSPASVLRDAVSGGSLWSSPPRRSVAWSTWTCMPRGVTSVQSD